MSSSPPDLLFDVLRNGDRSALGQAITLIESERASDTERAMALVERCLPHGANSVRIGITGAPGVGKSTLIDALGTWMVEQGHRVAVLAIDPSSVRTGGSILGDKTRMERLAVNDKAFIRPSPTGGTLGGVARRTREAIVLCEAAGYDRIIVETVGTGQSELDVDRMTDLNVLLLMAGAGDDLQGIKRGIMESADLIAFSKTEGAEHDRSAAARSELAGAVALLPKRAGGRSAEILLTSARTGHGIAQLGERIESIAAAERSSGALVEKRRTQSEQWLDQAVLQGLRLAFANDPRVRERSVALHEAVRDGRTSPFRAAQELLALFRKGDEPLP